MFYLPMFWASQLQFQVLLDRYTAVRLASQGVSWSKLKVSLIFGSVTLQSLSCLIRKEPSYLEGGEAGVPQVECGGVGLEAGGQWGWGRHLGPAAVIVRAQVSHICSTPPFLPAVVRGVGVGCAGGVVAVAGRPIGLAVHPGEDEAGPGPGKKAGPQLLRPAVAHNGVPAHLHCNLVNRGKV